MWIALQLAGAAFIGLMAGLVLGGVDGGGKWWEIAGAIGTCVTALLAIAIPFWQNWDRLREQRRSQVIMDWAIASEVHRLSSKIQGMADKWLASKTPPSLTSMTYLYSQIESTKPRTVDRFGLLIIADLLHLTAAMIDAIEVHSQTTERVRQSTSLLVRMIDWGISDATRAELEGAKRIHELTYRWMERLLNQFKTLGMQAPGVVAA